MGAVAAELVAGSGTATGLAWRIVEAGNRLEIATMFAALLLLGVLGVSLFAAFSLLEWALLRRWHESALLISLRSIAREQFQATPFEMRQVPGQRGRFPALSGAFGYCRRAQFSEAVF